MTRHKIHYKRISHDFHKYELTQAAVFRPRFDVDYWLKTAPKHQEGAFYLSTQDGMPVIDVYAGFKFNGLTNHPDKSWMMRASVIHDCLLGENMSYGMRFDRECVDRLFLSALMDTVDEESGLRWFRRYVRARLSYMAVKLYAKHKG